MARERLPRDAVTTDPKYAWETRKSLLTPWHSAKKNAPDKKESRPPESPVYLSKIFHEILKKERKVQFPAGREE